MPRLKIVSATHNIDMQSQPEGFSGVHTHNNPEIFYIKSGVITFKAGDRSYTASAGDLVYVGKLEKHSTHLIEGVYERYYVEVSYDLAGRSTSLTKLLYFFQANPKRFGHVIHMQQYSTIVENIFSTLVKEANSPERFSETYSRALMMQLLVLVSRVVPERFLDSHSGWDLVMLAIQKYFDEHFTDPISVEQVAKEHFLSPDYLSRRYKQATGFSPKQYICLSRLAYAKKLLMTSHLSVSEVAEKSGFSDVNNFIRSFKNQFGHSPGRFRSIEMGVTSSRRNKKKTETEDSIE